MQRGAARTTVSVKKQKMSEAAAAAVAVEGAACHHYNCTMCTTALEKKTKVKTLLSLYLSLPPKQKKNDAAW